MKRMVIAIFLILALTACSSGGVPKESAGSTTQDAMREVIKQVDSNALKWPKDRLHPDMPEFKKGKMNPWAGGDDDFYTLILEVSQADMEAYKSELLAAGFTEENDGFHKDLYDVKLKMNSDTILEIHSYKTETVGWPETLSAIPSVVGGDLAVVDFNEDIPDSITLYYINTPEEALKAWKAKLPTENVKFNGKTYAKADIWYEENGTNEWHVYFMFEN